MSIPHEGAPAECPACALVAAEDAPRWVIEARPWPEGWPNLRRPYRLTLEGVQVGVYGSPAEAMAAVPDGGTVLQVTLEGHRRIRTKG